MRILVYPHSTEIGGSQLNAIELAAAVRDRGHEVVVYAEPGVLLERVDALGLEWIRARPSRTRPGIAIARDLRRLVAERGLDVLHGWEWPPILEAYAAAAPPSRAVTVGSIMSMGVAPFLPDGVSLTVGTERLRQETAALRRGPVSLLEPPVDLTANRPGDHGAEFRRRHPTPPGMRQVVLVSRFAFELKLEGILTAIAAIGLLATGRDARLVVVGDGPAMPLVAQRAAEANARAGREVVLLTGELDDPRSAYDAADVCLAMGGSALRAMAFGKPLVVQGEGGFFEALTERSVDRFLIEGWYGVADRSTEEATLHLADLLGSLLDEPARCVELGAFGARLARERFGMDAAADRLIGVYARARAGRAGGLRWAVDGWRAGPPLVTHKLAQRRTRRSGAGLDDFNAVSR